MSENDVTILIPVRNGASFISDLFAYLATYIPSEIPVVIIEDCSTDDSFTLIERYSQNMSNVFLYRNQGSGLVEALNYGFSLCLTDWVARMDVDDIYSPNRLTKQLSYCQESVAVIFSDYRIFTTEFRHTLLLPNAIYSNEIVVSLFKNRRTPHPVAMINRRLFRQVGGYRKDAFPAEDLDLWFRLSKVGVLNGVPEELLEYRRHGLSITGSSRRRVLDKHAEIVASVEFQEVLGLSLKSTLENLDNTLKFYKNYDNPDIRIFLLILDIFHVYLKYPNLRFLKIKYFSFLSRHLSIYRGALKFSIMFMIFKVQPQITLIRTHSSGKDSKSKD